MESWWWWQQAHVVHGIECELTFNTIAALFSSFGSKTIAIASSGVARQELFETAAEKGRI